MNEETPGATVDAFQSRLQAAVSDQYQLHEELGRGGMGIVYRAVDRRLKRTVALKFLPPELAFRGEVRSRFLREAVSAAQLNHPNIVPIYSVDERDGLVFFAMGFIAGENLGARISREGRLSLGQAKRVLTEVGDALAYAHERGVVHRDIKPDNIILDGQSGSAMVTDFGIARAMSESGETRLTATGVAIGTPAYMSPEQCVGESELDGRSDLYSLGVVAYQMLTGRPPFETNSTPAMLMKHFSEKPEDVRRRNPGVPDDLADIVMRLLEKKPEDRFADGRQFAAVLAGGIAAAPAQPRVRQTAVERASTLERAGPVGPPPEAVAKEPKRKKDGRVRFRDKPTAERVRLVRIEGFKIVGTSIFLMLINIFTWGGFPWFVFPALGMGMGLWGKLATLWSEGLRWNDVFGSNAHRVMAGGPAGALPHAAAPGNRDAAEQYAPRDVLDGPNGGVVRQAIADHEGINVQVSRLAAGERQLIPDVLTTARDLLDRVVILAGMLGSLDSDVDSGKMVSLDERIAAAENEGRAGANVERKLMLLRKQRNSLQQLADSRAAMHSQFEGAALMLQNLALDVLRLRSAGIHNGVNEVNSATMEARALIREIGYAVGAADEIGMMESQSRREKT